jgi:hypothetical protein
MRCGDAGEMLSKEVLTLQIVPGNLRDPLPLPWKFTLTSVLLCYRVTKQPASLVFLVSDVGRGKTRTRKEERLGGEVNSQTQGSLRNACLRGETLRKHGCSQNTIFALQPLSEIRRATGPWFQAQDAAGVQSHGLLAAGSSTSSIVTPITAHRQS